MTKKITNGLDLQNQRIQGLGDPQAGTDAANRQFVENIARGLSFKDPVRAASTGNINLAAPGSSIDGVTMAAGDRFLAKDQATGSQKGIYVWNGASAAATRAPDADSGTELRPGTTVFVTEGTVNGDKQFVITSDTAIAIGTSDMTWSQFGGGTTYTASNGATLVGNDFRGVAAPGGGLTVGATGFSIDTAIVARKVAGNLGNGTLTSIPITHNLGTKDVHVSLRLNSTDEEWIADWVATDANTVTFTFPSAPASGAYRYAIFG